MGTIAGNIAQGVLANTITHVSRLIKAEPTSKAARVLGVLVGHGDSKAKFLSVITSMVERSLKQFDYDPSVVKTLKSELPYLFWFQFCKGLPFDSTFKQEITDFCCRDLGSEPLEKYRVQREELAEALADNFALELLNHFPEGANWARSIETQAIIRSYGDEILRALSNHPPYGIPSYEGQDKLKFLHYLEQLTPMFGRESEMDDLRSFRDEPRPFLWWVIYGPGGSGKSRMGLEWLKECDENGWNSVFLDAHRPWKGRFKWVPAHRTAFVIDYASNQEKLEQLIDYFGGIAKVGSEIRVLLLDRGAHRPWWFDMLRKPGHKTENILSGRGNFNFQEPKFLEPIQDLEILFDEVVKALNGQPCISSADRRELKSFLSKQKVALLVLGAAGIWAENPRDHRAFRLGDEEILDWCLHREVERWLALVGEQKLSWVKKAIGFVTMC